MPHKLQERPFLSVVSNFERFDFPKRAFLTLKSGSPGFCREYNHLQIPFTAILGKKRVLAACRRGLIFPENAPFEYKFLA